MKLSQQLIPGVLIQRYKRFLADIKLSDGKIITAYCPNSGSMLSCNIPGSEVLLSYHQNLNRKYAYTWEMIKVNSIWVGINTNVPNKLVYQSILENKIPELIGYEEILREQKVGQRSRLDLMLRSNEKLCYIEVKNVTLVEEGMALFPDAVTARGTRHLQELIELRENGYRAVIFFVIQRMDGQYFEPADHIDHIYGEKLREAYSRGVEILPYRAVVTPEEIKLDRNLQFKL
ncbi:MAG: DNA/RNA nuclease SfsA [bacterium]|nr:MAG: DNA/RNA nuclease SfsA [bacterium]